MEKLVSQTCTHTQNDHCTLHLSVQLPLHIEQTYSHLYFGHMDERNYTQTLLSIKICLGLCKTHGYYLQCPPTTVRSWRDSFIAVQYPIIPILYKFTHTFPSPPRLSITLSDSQMDGLLLGIITVRSHEPEEETVWKQETRGVSLCVASESVCGERVYYRARAVAVLYDSIWAGLLSLGSRDYSRLSREAYARLFSHGDNTWSTQLSSA